MTSPSSPQVGTTWPIQTVTALPSGTQIAAAGGSIINTHPTITVFVAPKQQGQASSSQVTAINPGGAINWPAGLACWCWCEGNDPGQVFVSPGLSQFEAGGLPWSGQGVGFASGLVTPNQQEQATGNGWVITDAMLSAGASAIASGDVAQLVFTTDGHTFLAAPICEITGGNPTDHFNTARGLFIPPGEWVQLIVAGSWAPTSLDASFFYDQL